jgi:hypothetical protein
MQLPGADLVERGIVDLRARRETREALLVSIGSPRPRMLGIDVPEPIATPEHRPYALLARDGVDAAHGRYDALLRRLVSYERAAAVAAR